MVQLLKSTTGSSVWILIVLQTSSQVMFPRKPHQHQFTLEEFPQLRSLHSSVSQLKSLMLLLIAINSLVLTFQTTLTMLKIV